MTDKMLNVNQVASVLGVTDYIVRGLIHSGSLKAFRVGKGYRISESELQRYLSAMEAQELAKEPHTLVESANNGKYALDTANGHVLASGDVCSVQFGGVWFKGRVEHSRGQYIFVSDQGDTLALTVGMRVRV